MLTPTEVAYLTADAWRSAAIAGRQANADTAVHASQLHDCPRRLHYRVQDVPASDPNVDDLGILAHWGTALHEFYLPYLADQWRARHGGTVTVEPRLETVVEGVTVVARPDLVAVGADGIASLFEFKTTGKAGVDAALAGNPRTSHLDQCRLGAHLLEATTGAPVDAYWIYYLDRADPERHWALVHRPWNDDEAAQGEALVTYAGAVGSDIAAAPRWFGRHPADAAAPHSPCRACPWMSTCLGKNQADPIRAEAAAAIVEAIERHDEALSEAETTLAEFLAAKAGVERYRRGKEYLTDLVAHLQLPPGEYRFGEAVRTLVWREGHDRTDAAAAAAALERAGIAVPKRRTAGYYQLK